MFSAVEGKKVYSLPREVKWTTTDTCMPENCA